MLLSKLEPPFLTVGPFDCRTVVAVKNTVEVPMFCSVMLNLYLYAVLFL